MRECGSLTITDLYTKMKSMLMVIVSLLQVISKDIDNWYFQQKSWVIEVVFKNLG